MEFSSIGTSISGIRDGDNLLGENVNIIKKRETVSDASKVKVNFPRA
jgi:hypothetical protein